MKLNPKIYLKAAKILVNKNEDYACSAINHAIYGPDWEYYVSVGNKELEHFESIFKPINHSNSHPWYSYSETPNCIIGLKDRFRIITDTEFDEFTELGRLGRSLMLLFMYELVKEQNKIRSK